MKRWNENTNKREKNIKIDNFIKEINKMFKKYNLCIGHEDIGGAFIIYDYDKEIVKWFNAASFNIKE